MCSAPFRILVNFLLQEALFPSVLDWWRLFWMDGSSVRRFSWTNRKAELVQILSFSASYLFLLLMVFATTETLSRLPAGKPIASGLQSPSLAAVHATLLLSYLVGVYL